MGIERAEFGEWSAKLAELYGEAALILDGLDDLGLHQAGGYLSMAMELMQQAHRARLKPD